MKAIIVVADTSPSDIQYRIADRFSFEGGISRLNLNTALKFHSDDVFYILSGKLNNSVRRVQELIECILLEYREEDFCLFYIGHGQPEGWALSGILNQEVLSYEDLNLVLALHSGSLIFVNCCCYAGSAEKSLQARSGEFFLLAAMPSFVSGSANNFIKSIFKDWSIGKHFNPESVSTDDSHYGPVIFGNSDLEKLVFPKKRR